MVGLGRGAEGKEEGGRDSLTGPPPLCVPSSVHDRHSFTKHLFFQEVQDGTFSGWPQLHKKQQHVFFLAINCFPPL